jgi:hypothetical protein
MCGGAEPMTLDPMSEEVHEDEANPVQATLAYVG